MIHHLTIKRAEQNTIDFRNDDGTEESAQHDNIQSVELTVEQHFGIKVYDDDEKRTWVMLRQGGTWSEPIPAVDFIKSHRK